MLLTTMLRIVVPALWGGFISWAIGIVPALAPVQAHLLGLSDVILPVITALIIGAWVAFWHWLQPRLPDWVVRALLGSAKTPVYQGKHEAGAVIIDQGDITIMQGDLPITGTATIVRSDSTP